MIDTIRVGYPIPGASSMPQGVFFDAGPSGYTMTWSFPDPRPEEIAAFDPSQPFEIRWTTINDCLVLTAKAGSMNWSDAPFAPQLCRTVTDLVTPPDPHSGTALTVILVDSLTAVCKSIRLIGLGHDFSMSLLRELDRLSQLPFDADDYYRRINYVLCTHTTREIARQSSHSYKSR